MHARRNARAPARCASWLVACMMAGMPGLAEAEQSSIPSPAELEAAGAVIGRVTIVTGNIFDPSIKSESGWLYRTANALHIKTRPSVIREQLLFKSGDPYVAHVVQESARNLRRNHYLYDAKIVPVAYDGHTVDLEVRTYDNWTLNPGLNYGRTGGTSTYNVHIQEQNLLGTGRLIELAWDKNVDRTATTLEYFDPHLLHSFTRLDVIYSNANDGYTRYLLLDRPFYSLDTRWSAGTLLNNSEFTDYRYDLGHRVGEFRQHDQYYQVSGGWSRGLEAGWVRRWTYGATFQQDQFQPSPNEPLGGPLPPDRKFVYPWVRYELLQNAYEVRVNQDQIARTEDVLVGFDGWVRLGYAPASLGSDSNAVLLSAFAQDGRDFGATQSLFGSASLSGRYEHGQIQNGILSGESRYYLATSRKSKFYASVSGTITRNLDEETQLTLGGDTGLRGYPLRYQAGTAKALLTLEQRYYTDWYPFRLFRVGGAAFFDMGRTWGRDVTGATSMGLLKDVGIGLRLGSSRSSFGNVIHIDLAFPLDGGSDISRVQFVVETSAQF